MAAWDLLKPALEDRFRTLWLAGSYSAVPWATENKNHDLMSGTATWVNLFSRTEEARRVTLGLPAKRFRCSGYFYAEIRTKEQGTRTAMQMAESIIANWTETSFRDAENNPIMTGVPFIKEPGPTETWYLVRVCIPFEFEYGN